MRKHRWNRLFPGTVNLEIRPLLQFTSYLRSGRREREAPAPTRDRTVPPARRHGCPLARRFSLPRRKLDRVYAYYVIYIRRNNKGPGIAEALMLVCKSRLRRW